MRSSGQYSPRLLRARDGRRAKGESREFEEELELLGALRMILNPT